MPQHKPLHSVLSIAGSDSSGGAGIQADIKAISATGAYAASVITALTAQNTRGVQAIESVSPLFVTQQLEAVLTDLEIKAVKIGMLHTAEIIQCVADAIVKYKPPYVVLDPVMVSKNGSPLLEDSLINTLKTVLFPHVNLLTPNILEAEKIAKNKIQTMDDMEKAACLMSEKYHIDVLLKGGHLDGVMAPDILCQAGECTWFELKRINTKNTHGTGCTLSAAIASYIAQGQSLQQAVFNAKHYLFEAILFGSKLSLGEGYGPVHHFYGLNQHASLINYTRTPRTS
ncbi:MAG: bifunctional hydroxymethylpyrimidine kinase/phosphomethylpyrimidine kinase [Gammaproteobacteria bacterium]|nr:bifunctional hydroxymethylpyrimidine kinase/phosphomethylpyrimidine kinase [Gammaproteobacteria bacterium]